MQVDKCAGTLTVEYFPDAFHHRPVKRHVVDVETVNSDVFDEPIKTLEIVVVPPGNAAVYHGGILESRHEPAGDIVRAKVFLQPGMTTAGTVCENLIVQTAQCKYLGTPVGQLTHRVIYLNFHLVCVCGVHVILHLLCMDKRIIDVGIGVICVVIVDGIGAGLGYLADRFVAVIESC